MNQLYFRAILLVMTYCHNATILAASEAQSETETTERHKRINSVSYNLDIDITDSQKFIGKVTIDFKLFSTPYAPTFDFSGGTISTINVNNKPQKFSHQNGRITLAKELTTKNNQITISYEHPYSHDGTGLHRFEDPVDQNHYVYTHFQPYSANKFFPHFDQPDIKATYKLTVKSPKNWHVITSVLPSRETQRNNHTIWSFPKSKTFSSYLLSLHAGPFHVWEDKQAKFKSRLFARRSMARFIDSELWFSPTRNGMRYFQAYFDFDYPFEKYDQVIVPEFNSGAMENVAAVTFSENYIHRGKETAADKERLATVILHELSHMWFGNLVTMKWWDDLWLNESFATFMATAALKDTSTFKHAWSSFYKSMKQWAYWEDQLVTAHPVATDIKTTDQANTIFNGITYGKGASILKQLNFLIGDGQFKKAIREYIKKFAYKNATANDFFDAFANIQLSDLNTWRTNWIDKTGVNTIKVSPKCENGLLKQLIIKQDSPSPEIPLRHHKTTLAFLTKNSDHSISVNSTKTIEYKNKEMTTNDFTDEPCPLIIFPNYGDFDYVRIELNKDSVIAAEQSVSKIDDQFLRIMLWQTLWDMVQDAKLSPKRFLSIMEKQLQDEQSDEILEFVFKKALGTNVGSKQIFHYFNKNETGLKETLKERRRLEDLTWQKFLNAPIGSDQQIMLFEMTVKATFSKERQPMLTSYLEGKQLPKGLILDQDKRWLIILRLARIGVPTADELIAKESQRDLSNRGKLYAKMGDIIQPVLSKKAKWAAELSSPKNPTPMQEKKALMRNLFITDQNTISEKYLESFFKNLNPIIATNHFGLIASYTSYMLPDLCDERSYETVQNFLKTSNRHHPAVERNFKIYLQENRRCLKIRHTSLK